MGKHNYIPYLVAFLFALPISAQQDSIAVASGDSIAVVNPEAPTLPDTPTAIEQVSKADKKEKKEKAKKEKESKATKAPKAKKGKNAGDPVAAKVALKAIIEKFDEHKADTVVRQVVEQFHDDPSVAVSVAHSFIYRNNGGPAFDYGKKYVDEAIAINPNYAPSFLLMGKLYDSKNYSDTAKAIEWYEKAIVADPTNPEGYEGKAKYMRYTSLQGTIDLFQQAKKNIPSYPVNLRIANALNHRYTAINKGEIPNDGGETMTNLIKYMEIAERDSMKPQDFDGFASWFFGAGKLNGDYYVTGLNLAKEGMSRYPDYPAVYRVGMYNAVARGLYKEAVPYGERLFANPDTLVNGNDYYYMLRAYYGAHQYQKCIKACEDLLARTDAADDHRGTAIRNMANSYKELGEYEKADNVYADYISKRKADNALTFADMWAYAGMYKEKASESNGQEMLDAYKRAFDLYGESASLDYDQSWMAYYTQIQLANQFLDKEKEAGLAVKAATGLCSYYSSQSELDENDKQYYIYGLGYLGLYYYTVRKNKNQAKPYWKKIHELDPTNQQANYVLKFYK